MVSPPRSSTQARGPSAQSEIPTSSSHRIPPDISIFPETDNIDDGPPPPYTPAANPGEETVGLGPRRPFQQPSPLPSSSLHPYSEPRPHSNWQSPYIQPSPTGPGSNSGLYVQPAPWQTRQQYHQRQQPSGGLLGALFDTVRDIADVVSGAHDERLTASRTANAGAYAAPYASSNSLYAPPPGPPPVHPPLPPRAASTPPRSPPSTVPDDGSPTRTPVPGHPLLRDGKLLVYPKDHLCVKCKNTGYKNYDPSHPCRKCWEKYGKAYTGALSYTPWSSSGNDRRMQRPLPKFVPPHLTQPSPGSSWVPTSASQPPYGAHPPPPQHPQHNRSISQPHLPDSGPSYYVLNPLCPRDAPPVPHAIPVSPGDPRLGGRLCMRCGGDGIRTVFLIDDVTCDTCGGTGRVWM
ncbi:hypothetical protein HD554DRAFT_2071109 [Boletus coccyginus]|nr:hypothetical protein HD554DRAFT_2071109 [Boletus coccyginus]